MRNAVPAAIVGLYADDATLRGTVASTRTNGRDSIARDFAAAFQAGLKVSLVAGSVEQGIGDDAAVVAGEYTFTLVRDGRARQIPARFTFVLARSGEAWRIAHQHSSLLPDGVL